MIKLLPHQIFRFRHGLSLIEIIVAVALFSLFATALIGLVMINFGSDVQAQDKVLAARFAEQGLEAAQSIRRQAWNFLVNGTYGVTSISTKNIRSNCCQAFTWERAFSIAKSFSQSGSKRVSTASVCSGK